MTAAEADRIKLQLDHAMIALRCVDAVLNQNATYPSDVTYIRGVVARTLAMIETDQRSQAASL
jgi:hypothetical protein